MILWMVLSLYSLGDAFWQKFNFDLGLLNKWWSYSGVINIIFCMWQSCESYVLGLLFSYEYLKIVLL